MSRIIRKLLAFLAERNHHRCDHGAGICSHDSESGMVGALFALIAGGGAFALLVVVPAIAMVQHVALVIGR